MKKILILLLVIISINAVGQFPNQQGFGTATTQTNINGGLKAWHGIINGVYADTTAANADYIDWYKGAQIYAGGHFWIRDSLPMRWSRMMRYSELPATPTLQQVFNSQSAVASMTTFNTIDINGNGFMFDDGDVRFKGYLTWDAGVGQILGKLSYFNNGLFNLGAIEFNNSSNGNNVQVYTNVATSNRQQALQDKSGTIALLSDITDSIAAHGGGGSGTNNLNVGSGYRIIKELTQEAKTLRGETGVIIDSSSHTNELTFKADTVLLKTKDDTYRIVDSLKNAGWGSNSINYDPWYKYYLDLASGANGTFRWVASGAGASVTFFQGSDVPDGWLLGHVSTTGTTSTGQCYHYMAGSDYAAISISNSYRYNFGNKTRFEDLSDGTETFTFYCGFIDNVTGAANVDDGIYFRYAHTDSSGKWIAVTESNNTKTEVATSTTVAADTDYELEITVVGGTATFYINKVVAATISTNIPTGSTRWTSAGQTIIKSAGTTPRKVYTEWMALGKRSN